MMKLFFTLLLFFLTACTTIPPHMTSDVLSLPLVIPYAVKSMFDGPGSYGNWWKKEPIEEEKNYFNKAFQGTASPREKATLGGFVGWHGVILACKQLNNAFELEIDHRHSGALNVLFGTRDSDAIYTVSLSGDGIFKAVTSPKNKKSKICPNAWMPGDLVRVYGTQVKQNEIKIQFVRIWPRWAYTFSPTSPILFTNKRYLRSVGRESWIQLKHDFTINSNSLKIDGKISRSLIAYLSSTTPYTRQHAVFNFGEFGQAKDVHVLEKLNEDETDKDVSETINFALNRLEKKIGPWWKKNAPSPYWKKISY